MYFIASNLKRAISSHIYSLYNKRNSCKASENGLKFRFASKFKAIRRCYFLGV